MNKCEECIYCPDWEHGYAMGEDFESQYYKHGECKFNGEPILFTNGEYFVDGTSDGAAYLGCCNFKRRNDESRD